MREAHVVIIRWPSNNILDIGKISKDGKNGARLTTRQSLDWNPQPTGSRRRGRSKSTWPLAVESRRKITKKNVIIADLYLDEKEVNLNGSG